MIYNSLNTANKYSSVMHVDNSVREGLSAYFQMKQQDIWARNLSIILWQRNWRSYYFKTQLMCIAEFGSVYPWGLIQPVQKYVGHLLCIEPCLNSPVHFRWISKTPNPNTLILDRYYLSNISLSIYTTSSLSIPMSMDI